MKPRDYVDQEIAIFQSDMMTIERSPLSDRKEGLENLKEDIATGCYRLFRGASFLTDGSMGYGALAHLKRCSKRTNRCARLFLQLAALEFGTSGVFARKLWNGLDENTQSKINAEFDKLLEELDNKERGDLIGL